MLGEWRHKGRKSQSFNKSIVGINSFQLKTETEVTVESLEPDATHTTTILL